MKQKVHYLFMLLLMLVVGVGYAGADTSTLTFTAACGGSGTADDGAKWTVTSDGSESNFDSTSGIHYGTKSASVTYLQLATSDIPGTITQVVVNARDAQATATISVTVGGTAFTCSGSATATTTSADYTFTGSGNGEIVVKVDRGESQTKAIYVKSVAVTYQNAGTQDGTIIDIITSNDYAKNNAYADFTITKSSGAEFKGNAANPTTGDRMQFNSTSPSGITVTKSIGTVRRIVINWNSNTDNKRVVDIYGSNTAYSGPADLYNTTKKGTKIGSFTYDGKTSEASLNIVDNYSFVGIRSNKNALYLNSIKIEWEKASESSVATPTFSVPEGTYFEAQSVELTCATDGATIYYTTDGTDPTAESTEYTGAISISETTTLKAIAIKGEDVSAVAEATYTIITTTGKGTLENPYTVADANAILEAGVTPKEEVYVKGIVSQIDDINTTQYYNATYYISDNGLTDNQFYVYRGKNLNNTNFTSEEELQKGDEIVVYGNLIIYGNNNVFEFAQGNYIVSLKRAPAAPTFSPVPNEAERIFDSQEVTINCETEGAEIYYQLDGSEDAVKYEAPFTLTETTAVRAWAQIGEMKSKVVEANYIIVPAVASIDEVKYETLGEAFEMAEAGQTVTLLNNTEVTSAITVDKNVKLVLAGNVVENNVGNDFLFTIAEGCSLEIDGDAEGSGMTIPSTNTTAKGFVSHGGHANVTLNVHGGKYSGNMTKDAHKKAYFWAFGDAANLSYTLNNVTTESNIYVLDINSDSENNVLNVTNCTFTDTGDHCVMSVGGINLTATFNDVTVNTEKSLIVEVAGAKATFTDCNFTNPSANETGWMNSALSASYNADVTIESGTYGGTQAVYLLPSSGKVTINGGTFTGEVKSSIASNSYGLPYYSGKSELVINGGTFNNCKLTVEDTDQAEGHEATITISGGVFDIPVPAEFCAPGYEPKDLGNGQYSVYAPTYEVAIKSVTPKADSWYISGTPYIQFTITKDGQVLSTKQLNQEQLEKWDIILDENYLTLKSKAAFAKWLQYNFNVVGAGTTTIVFQNKANPSIKVEQEVTISHKLTLTIQPAGTHMVEAGPVEIATNTKFDGVAIENFEDYTFTSSDESIATISGTTITPLKAGTITVTATKNDDQTASASANVTFIDAPAKIGDVYYESIGKAMEAAQSGETITLLRDVTESYPFTGNQPRTNDFALTIDLNGHTWNGTSDKPYVLRVDYGTITIKDSQSGGGVKYGSDYAFIVSHLASEYPSKLILENGTFTGKTSVAQVGNPGGSGSNKKYYGGDLVVNGGTFVTVPDEGETYDENGNFKYTLNKLDMVESSYPGGIYSPSTITVNGGKFLKFDPQNNLAEGANTNFVPEGLVSTKSVESGEAWYTISKIVAKIDETTYASLADAFTAATDGQTITVLTDIDLPSTIAVTKQVTLNLDGKTISNTSDLWVGGNWSFFSVQANGNLTVTGDGTIDAKENDCYTFDVRNGGILTIKDGTFTGNISCVYLYNKENIGVSTCNIEGGTFSIKQLADEQDDRYRFLLNCYDASYKNNTVKFNVTGGSFVNFNPANNQAEGAETNFCAAGYEAVQDGNVWTVQQIQLSAPIIFHDSGEYEGELQIAMAGEGTIMYTLNEGEAQTYSAPFTIRDEGKYIIKAWAVKDGVASDVTEPKTFTIKKKTKSAVVEDGYYTIQTNDDDGKYVNVAGRKTVTLVSDMKSAGTVIRVKADEDGVKVLRSQAVDLPRYAERAMSYVPEIVKEVVKKLAANVDDPIIGEQGADLILDKFKKEFDYHLYLEGENNTYRIYGRTPSMKPVVDFYAENKELVDSRLPKVEKFVKEVLQEIVNKVGRGQSVVDMFKVKTIWEKMGGKLTDPDVDQAKFFEEVLSSEKNTWEFAYQTGMLYWEKVKGYLTDNISELGDYGKYIEKIPQIRPNFRYYIVPGENGVDIISEGNSQITDASTAWTLTKREGFDVTFDATLSKNNGKEMYKTLYVDFGYKLPDGVTALKVTAIDENTGVAKTEEIGQEVAPQTPVLLKSDKAGDITLTIGDNFGSAVTDNQLVGADYLINKYEINTPQVESIFTLLANLSKSLANEYSYLKRKNAGTVNNKYFFGLTKDDLKLCYYLNDNEEKDCVVRSLSMGDEKLGFYNNWTAKANEAFLVSEQFNPVKLTLKGDVNRDGSITIADVTALVNIILGKATYPADADKYDFEAAHVNADEDITIADVTALVNIILGK